MLTDSNSFYGGKTTIAGGALVLGNVGVLSPLWSSSGNLTVPAGATLGVEAGSNPGEFSLGNIGTVLGNVGFAASANLGIQVIVPETFNYSNVLANTASGALGLVKLGGGVLDLSVSNSYTGATTISAGTLKLGNANAAQGSVVANNAAGGLAFVTSGTTYNIAGLSGSGTFPLLGISGGSVTLSVGGGGAASTYAGTMSGSGALTVTGSGKEVLSGSNTYSGNTTILSGILQLGNGGTGVLSPTSTILLTGGTLGLDNTAGLTQGTNFSTGASREADRCWSPPAW